MYGFVFNARLSGCQFFFYIIQMCVTNTHAYTHGPATYGEVCAVLRDKVDMFILTHLFMHCRIRFHTLTRVSSYLGDGEDPPH